MFTIGHSTLPGDVFIKALHEEGVRFLVDIRTIPKSRHNPQFMQEALAGSLHKAGIAYRWQQSLGGLRHAHKDSINMGWHNPSFRGYADYMQTKDFESAIDELLQASPESETAIMCAEAVPWRCHRSLVADALTARNVSVENIFCDAQGRHHRAQHKFTSFARVEGERVWYPPEDDLFAAIR